MWIRSKYVDRKFVTPITNITSTRCHASREQMQFRKWSVRKLRRRARSCDKIDNISNRNKTSELSSVKERYYPIDLNDSKHISAESLNFTDQPKKTERDSLSSDDSANIDLKNNSTLYGKILNRTQNDIDDANKHSKDTIAQGELLQDIDLIKDTQKVNTSVIDNNIISIRKSESSYIDKNINDIKDVNKDVSETKDKNISEKCCNKTTKSDVLMFGCDIPKPTIDSSLELSSDQDSTAGEDEEFTDEEDITNLHPDILLYKAAGAHNVPIMCAALAAGADKLWSNINDKSRNALHQAIISVCDLNLFVHYTYYYNSI